MGWFFEDKTELVPTGRVIAEERPAGGRLTELGKLLLIVAVAWVIGSAPADDTTSTPGPQVTVQPSAAPSPPAPGDFR